MNTLDLTDEEYEILKKKLHQAHDKVIKVTLHEKAAMRELLEKIVMPLLENVKIDLEGLKLDTTTYIRQNLQVFFSDIVYMTSLIDEQSGLKKPVKVALLVEHKSEMPTQLAMRLQATDYINAIMKKNYNKDTDKTIPVITIIFNQFDKDWEAQPYRSLFPELSQTVARLIPEFDLLVINLSSLSEEIMASLDKFGILKAALLAMKYVRNKRFLIQHFEEIFLFLQKHPDKTDLRDQLISYLLGHSPMDAKEIEELLANIFSPVLKHEVMLSQTGFYATAYREAKAKAKIELKDEVIAEVRAEEAAKAAKAAEKAAAKAAEKAAEKAAKKAQVQTEKKLQFKTVMHGWHKSVPLDVITNMVDLPESEVKQLMDTFEKVKTYCLTKIDMDLNELKRLSGLTELELKALLVLWQK